MNNGEKIYVSSITLSAKQLVTQLALLGVFNKDIQDSYSLTSTIEIYTYKHYSSVHRIQS